MVQLELDHPLPVEIPRLHIKPNYPEYIRGLEKYEFKTLLPEVQREAANTFVRAKGKTSRRRVRQLVEDSSGPPLLPDHS